MRWKRGNRACVYLFLVCGFPLFERGLGENLLVNGSFELGPPCSMWAIVSPGSSALPGWEVTGDGVDVVCSIWNDIDGDRSIDLNAYETGAIHQTFPTTPGDVYLVTFKFAGNPGSPCGPTLKRMVVKAGGQQMEFAFDTSNTSNENIGWMDESWPFMANDTETTIDFESLVDGNCGPVVDDVRVFPSALFVRGDANDDGRVDISDAIAILGCLFVGNACSRCPVAADADGSEKVNITDSIYLLVWLFQGDGQPPPQPFPACGTIPEVNLLGPCEASWC